MWVFQSTLIFEKTHYSSVEEAFLIIQICLQYALIGPEGAVETKIEINPRGVKIKANTVGFFIANDAEEVRRANTFCKVTGQYDCSSQFYSFRFQGHCYMYMYMCFSTEAFGD